jgi:hypothetical protein
MDTLHDKSDERLPLSVSLKTVSCIQRTPGRRMQHDKCVTNNFLMCCVPLCSVNVNKLRIPSNAATITEHERFFVIYYFSTVYFKKNSMHKSDGFCYNGQKFLSAPKLTQAKSKSYMWVS